MINFDIDEKNLLVEVHPKGPLQKEDFVELTTAVDKLIEKKGKLSGLLIETESFPGWESMGAFVQHMQFIKDHHKKVKKIALVTDTKVADVAESLVSHFVMAEIKKFPAGDGEEARKWIVGH